MLMHYNDVIMTAMASKITSLTIVYSGTDERKHQCSASLAFVKGIHRSPVNSPHQGPAKRKLFPFDDVIMVYQIFDQLWLYLRVLLPRVANFVIYCLHDEWCKFFMIYSICLYCFTLSDNNLSWLMILLTVTQNKSYLICFFILSFLASPLQLMAFGRL